VTYIIKINQIRSFYFKFDFNSQASIPGLPRPILSAQSLSSNSKIPAVLRQKMLDLLVDKCLEYSDSVEDAYQRALDTENSAFEKCVSKGVYHCRIMNCVSMLRKAAMDKKTVGSGQQLLKGMHCVKSFML